MKTAMKTLAVAMMMAGGIAGQPGTAQIDQAVEEARRALERAQNGVLDGVPGGIPDGVLLGQTEKLRALEQQLAGANLALGNLAAKPFLAGVPGLAFAPFQDRARDSQERAREKAERDRDTEDRNIETYRAGTNAIDEGQYERAIRNFDRLTEIKWSRADGAYYWKAYALNKLGKRDDALAALAEIPKQFPQSRWINDANALKAEIQQAAGNAVSPESQADEDLKLLAINALLNSEPDRAIPLLEKVINDPKNSLGIKARALFVLAQSRNEKGREIVAQYARNGSNPDLQIRAVTYLGTYRSKDSQQVLADVYASVNDVAVKRAVLRSMMISRDTTHLFNAAKSEQNADLRREAIRQLGTLQAVNELSQLYATETNVELKGVILQSIHNGRGGDRLIDIARTEKDPQLRAQAIRYLGMMRGNDKVPDALVAMYASETDKAAKGQLLRSLWMDGAAKQLVEAIRSEKDPELKKEGVQMLGNMKGSKEATDYLLELINK
jgi:tetratricopeptide (TPR) repeat protein